MTVPQTRVPRARVTFRVSLSLRREHLGASAARNRGLKVARGRVILFLDSDCAPQSSWIREISSRLVAQESLVTVGRFISSQTGLVPRLVQQELEERFRRMKSHRDVDFLNSATCGFALRVIDQYRFDPDFDKLEDVDLSFRLAAAGIDIRYVPTAIVDHHHPGSLWAYLRRKFRYARAAPLLYKRFPRKSLGDASTPPTRRFQLALVLLGILSLPFSWMSGASMIVGFAGSHASGSVPSRGQLATAGCLVSSLCSHRQHCVPRGVGGRDGVPAHASPSGKTEGLISSEGLGTRRLITTNRFTTDAKLTLAGSLAQVVFGVVTAIILARSLGAENFGLYALYIVLVNVSVTLTNLGLSQSTTYYVASQTQSAQQIAKTSLVLSMIVGLVAALAGCILIRLFPSLLAALSTQLFLLAIFLVLLKMVLLSAQGIVKGLQDFLFYNKIIGCVALFQAVLVSVLVGILGLGIWWALMAALLSDLAGLTVCLCGIRKRLGSTEPPPEDVGWGRWAISLFKFGLKSHLGGVFYSLTNRVDRLLLNALAGPLSLGIYQVAAALAERLSLISNTASVLFPRVASMGQDEQQRRRLTPIVARRIFWLMLIAAIPTFALADWLISLFFGVQYEPAGTVLKLLLPGFVLFSMSQALAYDIAGRGKPGLNTLHSAAALALNVLANLVLIPRYGVQGAAAAATLSYSFLAVIRVVTYSRIAKIRWYQTWVLTGEDLRLWERLLLNRP